MKKDGLIVVTGASSGIGKAFVRECFKRKLRVAATARKKDSLKDLSAQCELISDLDVADPKSVEKFAGIIKDRGERISVLFNNAGYGAFGALTEMSDKTFQDQFSVNVFGNTNMIRALFPNMIKGSLIIQMGSVSGESITPWSGAYGASKAALHALSDAVRMELSPFGIGVMTVKGNRIKSEFGKNAEGNFKSSKNIFYGDFSSGINKRIEESQMKTIPADKAVSTIIDAMMKKRPPRELRIGPHSKMLPIFEFLISKKLFDFFKMKKYGL